MTIPGYQRPQRNPDIEAEIYILREDEGGRRTPVQTGYRPSHNFGLNGMLNDAQHEYIGTDIVELGNTAGAYLWFLRPEYQEGRLYVGMEFTVQEGSKVIGRGRVTKIINSKLAKYA